MTEDDRTGQDTPHCYNIPGIIWTLDSIIVSLTMMLIVMAGTCLHMIIVMEIALTDSLTTKVVSPNTRLFLEPISVK